jgi:hypothetical protein
MVTTVVNKKEIVFCLLLSFFLLFHIHTLFAQDSTKSKISVSTLVNKTKVPLNRTFELKVSISWLGDSERIDVISFDNPALSNFEIVGTSTTSRTEMDQVFKDYTYTLKPIELGMGYVEGVIVKAHDKLLDKDENMLTQRIPVEVIDPVLEPGETRIPWEFIIPILVFLVLVLGYFFWYKKRQQKKQATLIEPETPLEINYIEDLKQQIDLIQPNLSNDFTSLSKLLRSYLKEKFDVRALEATTKELNNVLVGTNMEENQITSIREILSRSDEIKFSGIEGSKEELSRFYTLFEGILESFLRKAEAENSVVAEKK